MADEVVKPSEWIKLIEFALKALFGDHIPAFVLPLTGALLLIAILIAIALAILVAVAKARDIWIEKLRPLSYSPEEKKRSRNSRLFAKHVLREINQRNLSENWKDEEFAELEAEIEAQGQRHYLLPFRALFLAPTGIRREPSLTLALERSSERLILLEGDPGAGKSVALRHVAQNIATRASNAEQSNSVLPIFVNLKELKCDQGEEVNRELIRKFVLQSLNRINDRFIDEFLDAEFDRGLRDGRWILLFDSFDEIPAVLSSTEADAVIQKYSDAISDFLAGLNSCRGVVASRHYRGPSQAGWQKFRILELSSQRQEDLIEKALISPDIAARIRGELALASSDIQGMAKNPMLLGLLCEHMRLGNEFPALAHEVFEKYFNYRFKRDAERVTKRFGLAVEAIQKDAEQLAFAMANSPVLGLSPTRKMLSESLSRMGARWSGKRLNHLLDALEYMKIGRADRDGVSGDERQFTFSHRRFQEYFATCVVVRDPELVSASQLLRDARWRETAVVLCQTGRPEDVNALLDEAKKIILDAAASIKAQEGSFVWPEGVLHVLGLLQAGFGSSKSEMSPELRKVAARVIEEATRRGNLLDRKLALEVAAVAPQETLLELIRKALQLDSQWLNDVIYRQVAQLSTIPSDVLEWVRTAVLRIALGQGAGRKRDGLRAHLARLHGASDLLNSLRLAYSIRFADVMIAVALCALLYMTPFFRDMSWAFSLPIFAAIIGAHTLLWTLYRWNQFALLAFLRVYSCLLLVAIAFYASPNARSLFAPDWRLLVVLGSAYVLVWPFAAMACVKFGIAKNVVSWPFVPVLLVGRLQYSLFLRALLSKRGAIVTGIYTFCGAMLYLFWGAVKALLDFLVSIVAEGVNLFIIVGAVIVVGLAIVRLGGDHRVFTKARRLGGSQIGVRELSDLYREFSTGVYKFWFLNFVRAEGLLSRTSDMKALRLFAEEVDGDCNRGQIRISNLFGLCRILDFTVSSYRLERRDEIYILIEDLMRLGSLSQVVESPNNSVNVSNKVPAK